MEHSLTGAQLLVNFYFLIVSQNTWLVSGGVILWRYDITVNVKNAVKRSKLRVHFCPQKYIYLYCKYLYLSSWRFLTYRIQNLFTQLLLYVLYQKLSALSRQKANTKIHRVHFFYIFGSVERQEKYVLLTLLDTDDFRVINDKQLQRDRGFKILTYLPFVFSLLCIFHSLFLCVILSEIREGLRQVKPY